MKQAHSAESYLAGDVDERIPRYSAFLTEHLQVQQRTFTITVVKLILLSTFTNHKNMS